ncbi:aminotransferase class V-fold PLP-dependent enzyme [Marinigracilibium pacificum]|uniref:Aminotransferase class V-fold PLP-dependent enzyme n=1 Tax=Marinigracilibium pacificum TaxID=2729599 RepID=A0A848J0N0_9BACT|nr:aminotransferase class V-fold PLP-dependent enzyme [Marinigracilibium pacificum]NMM49075.1 aminotransferase class V-fold PLP-dependent enzyme [Marinigracilibium pacificum]
MDRRKFLSSSGLAIGLTAALPATLAANTKRTIIDDPKPLDGTWESVRSQFLIDISHIQMAQMLLASHPKPVRDAIQKHREEYDKNPVIYWEENSDRAEWEVAKAAARYMNVQPEEIALTDSTTMGTSLLFNGMKLKPGDEILSTTHDHYVTDKSIDYACERTGAIVKRIDEYKDPRTITVEEVKNNIANNITDKTRVVMVTWVHSCTGVKLPIRDLADVVEEANASRSPENRIYFAVDGVHGFGNQDEDISKLGCDFFSAGTHKWIFGPRGTGVLYGKRDAWDFIRPTIPAFSMNPYIMWMGYPPEGEVTFNQLMSPGGFHAFDHRWSLNAAFDFQMEMGRSNVHQRTTQLNSKLKEGIKNIKGVDLLTPEDPNLSAGINCFIVGKQNTNDSVKHFHDRNVIASSSPYRISYTRLTPCVINTDDEVDQSLNVLEDILKI